MDDLRYPVGNNSFDATVDEADYPKLIETIAAAPKILRDAVKGMSDEQMDTPYREPGPIDVRLAWPASYRAHHSARQTKKLVTACRRELRELRTTYGDLCKNLFDWNDISVGEQFPQKSVREDR